MTTFQAGFAETEWTPAPGLPLLGQMHQRIATHARDPLCVCAAAFRSDGETVIFVAVDVCVLDNPWVERTQAAWAQQSGLPARSLVVGATHTHVAPISTGALMEATLPEIEELLHQTVLQTAAHAVEKLEDVEVFAATGNLDLLGWNRRAMFEDGTSKMYADSSTPGFVGLEGPRDGALPVLWTRNKKGETTGVLTGFASHPNCLEGEHFYSADLPGAARRHIQQALGGNSGGEAVGVVYFTGAAGNTAPSQLDPPNMEWRGDAGVERSGQLIAGEALKLIATNNAAMETPTIKIETSMVEIPLRSFPAENEPSFPRPLLEEAWRAAKPYYEMAQQTWPERVAKTGAQPLNIAVVRIGDVAFCTNPAELFVEFGLEIKAVSPARVTFVAELTNGYCGYVPTAKAFAGGGYETWCAPSSQLAHDAGDQIVAATKELLDQAF